MAALFVVVLFCQVATEVAVDSTGRRLTGLLPDDVALMVQWGVGSPPAVYYVNQDFTVGGFFAGVKVFGIGLSLDATSDQFPSNAPVNGRLRIVPLSIDRARAQAGECKSSAFGALQDAVVSHPWSGEGSRVVDGPYTTSPNSTRLMSDSELIFRLGGEFRLCYSEDGTFERADIVRNVMQVAGAAGFNTFSCSDDPLCLYSRKHYCYLLKMQYNTADGSSTGRTSCEVFLGEQFWDSKQGGSWSSSFDVTYDWQDPSMAPSDVPVQVVDVQAKPCSTAPAAFLDPVVGGCYAVTNFKKVPVLTVGFETTMPLPSNRNDLGTCDNLEFRAYTVAACYCPDYDGCNSPGDFTQQVGILYYYVTKICWHGNDAVKCDPVFTGVAAPFRFSLQVSCPTDACRGVSGSRLKIVSKSVSNDAPSWSDSNGCFSAVHGISALGRNVLPSTINFLDVSQFDGGPREDLKLWNFDVAPRNASEFEPPAWRADNSDTAEFNRSDTTISDINTILRTTLSTTTYDPANETAGFLFEFGTNMHENRNYQSEYIFDVCFCNERCHEPRQWFKTGEVFATSVQLVSAATNLTSQSHQMIVQYVNKPGVLAFYRPQNASDQLGMHDGGMIKVLEDNAMSINDEECRRQLYSQTLTNTSLGSHLSASAAANAFYGKVEPAVDPYKLVFNGGDLESNFQFNRAGVIAICYCPRRDGVNCHRDNWALAARLTIRGPQPGQNWLFSTHVVFKFEVEGYGLSNTDSVRIVRSDTTCDYNRGRPDGDTATTGIMLECPFPCAEVGTAMQPSNGDITVSRLADDHYLCNSQGEECITCDIQLITVLSSTQTELYFNRAPGLEEGDLLTLGDNIICDPTDPYCTPDALATLKGQFNFVDHNENNPSAPDTYVVGHAVKRGTDQFRFVIPVGWEAPIPRFEVVQDREFRRGKWVRHSKATTREEIKGIKEVSNLKVCWKYGSDVGSYVAQVGTMSFKEPAPLSKCLVSMTSTVRRLPSPVIVSFSTSAPDVATRYSVVEGMTQLRLLWTDMNAIVPKLVDGQDLLTSRFTDEILDARQYICGSIFKEMWSSDPVYGFPLPRGCYLRSFGDMFEINLVFERKNGLRGDQDYQLVLNAATQEGVAKFGTYVDVTVMDDTDLRPYESIERGQAVLNAEPQSPAGGTAGVMFLEPNGVTAINGDIDGHIKMMTGSSLSFEIRGEPMGGGIRADSFLRIYLWPLTQWDVPVGCAATCVSSRESTTPCGAVRTCSGEATVVDFQRNVLKMQLPSTMTQVLTAGLESSYATITVADMTLPSSGFLPTNFGAQISMPITDARPHYLVSVGHLMFKAPDEGETYARLVDVLGDGDHRPFRGDKANVLYAHLVLGMTLFSSVQAGDATMTITLPEGYQCLRPQDLVGPNFEVISPWMAEENLTVLGSTIPQGRGTPDEGAGTRGWSVGGNTCTWRLVQNAVIYAYSSIYIRFTVNNPPVAMKREDLGNKWYVTLRGKGFSTSQIEIPPVLFTSSPPNFASNTPVLGRIDHATIVPWSWSYSQNAAPSDLYIFFLTQQLNNVEGFVQVIAPDGFRFDTKNGHCEATDLPDAYYAKILQTPATERLPGIDSCEYRPAPLNVVNLPLVNVKLEGMLVQSQWYGFKLQVRNAMGYSQSQQEAWKIFTLTKLGYRVDGTLNPVKMDTLQDSSLSSNKSFGLYHQSLTTRVFLPSLSPYAQSGRTMVTIRPIRVHVTVETTLRVIAPFGFIWDFGNSDAEFMRLPSGPHPVDCITAALPGLLQDIKKNGNLLYFEGSSKYVSTETYGFSTYIRVPARSPTTSLNAFIIQIGHDSTNGTLRLGSATAVPEIDFGLTNIEINQSHLIFQLQVNQDIKPGGRITITGPNPNIYKVRANCTHNLSATVDARGCPDASSNHDWRGPTMFLVDVICNSSRSNSTGLVIDLSPEALPIPQGLYRFQLLHSGGDASISRRLQSVPDAPWYLNPSSPCGLDRCWTYETVDDNSVMTGAFNGPMNVMERLRPGREVGVLSDASIDYENNVFGEYNYVTFTIRTVTALPPGGGLQIIGPEDFWVPQVCALFEPGGVRGSPYYAWSMQGKFHMMPDDAMCTSEASETDGTVTISIMAGPSGIPPQLYRFQVWMRNAMLRLQNPINELKPCGFRYCWLFRSILDLSQTPLVELDVGTSTPSFQVNSKFGVGNFSKLLPSQRTATLRDDRPMMSNSVIFQFSLLLSLLYPDTFKIRAPVGYVFREECLDDIITNASLVFGGSSLPTGSDPFPYAAWDPGTVITHCRGEGPNMVFEVDPSGSDGLPANRIIPIRVTIERNPLHLPIDNRWVMEFAGESTLPFDGLPVWTFNRTSVHGACWARRAGVMGVPFFTNSVTVTFRPSVTVRGTGMRIVVLAPPYYELVHDRFMCTIALQRLNVAVKVGSLAPPMNFTDISSLTSSAFVRWGESEYSCIVEPNLRRLIVTTTVDWREILAGEDYQMTVSVRNPTTIQSASKWGEDYPWVVTQTMWSVQIEAGPDAFEPSFRDLGYFQTGDTVPVLLPWVVSWTNPRTRNINDVTRGKEHLHNVRFTVGFFDMPREQDIILIEAPFGYNLMADPTEPSWTVALATRLVEPYSNWATCNNLAWTSATEYEEQLSIHCKNHRMRITVTNETFSFAYWTSVPPPIDFTMSLVTGVKTPYASLDYWIVRHIRDDVTLAENAMQSWPIRPELENVVVNLTGENRAAGATSTIDFHFIPMSDAAELIIEAKDPDGFNFKQALAVTLGHEVLPDLVNAYPPSEVRIRCTLYAGFHVMIRLKQVTLGSPGGWTMFDFTTRLSNGVIKDQSLNVQGYRQPGRLTVSAKSLQNKYQQDPVAYPLPALWKTRMSESATARFTFTFSQEAANGTLFRIRAPPYNIISATLSDMERDLDAEVYDLSFAEVTLRLADPIAAGEVLRVALPVFTPSVAEATDALWSFEFLDSELTTIPRVKENARYADDAANLPVNTNDASTVGFPLAIPLSFELFAARSPPLAEIEVSLDIDPQAAAPNEFVLVAAPDFNFTNNCLKDGAGAIESCTRTADILGRQAVVLRCKSPGMLMAVRSIIIKIVAPRKTPSEPVWYMEARDSILNTQLAWAEYTPGVQVKPMPNARVIFPGVTFTQTNQMVVLYQATIRAQNKSKIRVYYPSGYDIVDCDEADMFEKISLKADCLAEKDKSYFELFLKAPMDPGWQAFGVRIATELTPDPNLFDVLVYEPEAAGGKVIDAATDLPGLRSLSPEFKLQIGELVWSGCSAQATCQVQINFEFLEDLPINLHYEICEIVVRPPPTLEYKIVDKAEVKFGGSWPLREPPRDWLDVANPEYFRLLMNLLPINPVVPDKPQFKKGQYSFQFATKMPTRAPAANVWLVTFCGIGHGICLDPHDNRSLSTFPLVGFAVGATHATGLVPTNSDGLVRSHSFISAVLATFMYSWWLL